MNEEGLSGIIVGTSIGGIILVIVVSVSVGNLPHVFHLGEIIIICYGLVIVFNSQLIMLRLLPTLHRWVNWLRIFCQRNQDLSAC
jgi:membrane protein YdbS with pleckstrin-like domain